MEIMLGLLLAMGVVIMVALIFVGYFLYCNGKKNAQMADMLSSKESDLVELYDTLSLMIEEFESYIKKAKQEMEAKAYEIAVMHKQICTSYGLKEAACQTDASDVKENTSYNKAQAAEPEPVFDDDIIESTQEKLLKQIIKNTDTKSGKIRRFFKKGMNPAEIAKKMKIGQGEVELILNLKNKSGLP